MSVPPRQSALGTSGVTAAFQTQSLDDATIPARIVAPSPTGRAADAQRPHADEADGCPSSDVIRVLFIAGALRSGSTLLDRVVGGREGFCSVGEAHTIWRGSFEENQLCGCGVPFHECAFWQAVSRQAFDVGTTQFDPATAIHLKDSVGRIRHSPWLLLPRRPKRCRTALSAYGKLIEQLYSVIQAVSGEQVIVDSSKSPAHALILSQLPGVEVNVVHLVRDPRAVAFSWQRQPQRRPAENHPKAADMPIEHVSN